MTVSTNTSQTSDGSWMRYSRLDQEGTPSKVGHPGLPFQRASVWCDVLFTVLTFVKSGCGRYEHLLKESILPWLYTQLETGQLDTEQLDTLYVEESAVQGIKA